MYNLSMQTRAVVYGRNSSGKIKSINEQLALGHAAIRQRQWTHIGDYSDKNSASRFRKKNDTREDWYRLLDDLEKRKLDIVVLWESSRGDRTLSSWALFLERCRELDTKIYVIVDDYVYDMNVFRDWEHLANAGVKNAGESEMISLRARRGIAGAAAAGKIRGIAPYGLRRDYDPETGEFRRIITHEGEAAVVREIFRKVSKGVPLLAIEQDLNRRGIPPRRAKAWSRRTVKDIATNRVYLGRVVLNGQEHTGRTVIDGVEYEGFWRPIVDEDLFWSAQRALADPERDPAFGKHRPGAQRHLLSYLARSVSPCDAPLQSVRQYYRCSADGCCNIPRDLADEAVTTLILARLEEQSQAAPDTSESDRVAAAVREVARLRAELEKWRASAVQGKTSPESLAVIERGLAERIAAANARTNRQGTLVPMAELLEPGQNLRALWDEDTVQARRMVIAGQAVIRVGPAVVKGRRPASMSRDELMASIYARLGESQWRGEPTTWGEQWRRLGVSGVARHP